MSEFVLKEEEFKLGILDKVPEPEDGNCFLLYQAGAGMAKSMVISSGVRYSSAEVRHGKFNRKVVFSLNPKEWRQKQKVVMENQNFYFDVSVEISYGLQDVQEYFFKEKLEDADIQREIRKIIRKNDGKWNVKQYLEVQNQIEDEIEQRIRRYNSIRLNNLEVRVAPDEAAAAVIKSNVTKEVGLHTAKDEADLTIAKNVQKGRVRDSEYDLKGKQIRELALLMENFGSLGTVVDDYMQGKMDGTELYDYIIKAKTNDMSMLSTAVNNDLITQKEAINKLNEILEDQKFLQAGKTEALPERKENEIEEKKEEEDEEDTDEKPLTDGDYI